MTLPLLLSIALTSVGPVPQDHSQLENHPLWTVAQVANSLFLVDTPPATLRPSAPVDITFWVLEPPRDGMDAMAGRLTIDCAARSFAGQSFTGYLGTDPVGTAPAQDTAPEAVQPDTVFGAMVAHVCDPDPERSPTADYANLEQAQAARRGMGQ